MPWSKGNYPESLKNFDPRVRDKAVEIANALLSEGYNEGRAIAIATSQAKEWADNHPEHKRNNHSENRRNLHVVPFEGEWAIKSEGTDDPKETFETKSEAVEKAIQIASDHNVSAIVHRRNGTIESSHNYS